MLKITACDFEGKCAKESKQVHLSDNGDARKKQQLWK